MQLHLYLPDEVAKAVQKRAEARGISVSRYLAELVRREVGAGWPNGYFEDVVGKWEGKLERPEQGSLEPREPM